MHNGGSINPLGGADWRDAPHVSLLNFFGGVLHEWEKAAAHTQIERGGPTMMPIYSFGDWMLDVNEKQWPQFNAIERWMFNRIKLKLNLKKISFTLLQCLWFYHNNRIIDIKKYFNIRLLWFKIACDWTNILQWRWNSFLNTTSNLWSLNNSMIIDSNVE